MTYTLTLKLKTEIYQEHRINKSFDVAVRIYNSLLSHELKKLKSLENNITYKTLIDKKYKTKEDYNMLKSLREDFGFSAFSFNNDIKNIRKHYGHNMQSQVGQKLAKRLWTSFDKYFHGYLNDCF